MVKTDFTSNGDALATAPARCGLVIVNNWRRGGWWRFIPPAVPYASVFDGDSR